MKRWHVLIILKKEILMSSNTTGIIAQMRQRRIERKKPKRAVPLKKVALDANQQRSISTAQTSLPKHPITQKHVGRSSAAFGTALIFHGIIAVIIGTFYIVDQIELEQDTFDTSIVVEDAKPKRRLIRRERPKFTEAQQQQEKVRIQRPVTTATAQPLSNEGFVIPQATEDTVDLTTPGADEGPKLIEVERDFVKPTASVESATKAPVLDIPREAPSLINKLDTTALETGPGLDNINFESEPGVTAPRYKFQVEPKYPELASKAGKEGKVILQATIDANGIPQNIIALTNIGFGFEDAAIAALKKTTFQPAMKAGSPVEFDVEVPYVFTLKDR